MIKPAQVFMAANNQLLLVRSSGPVGGSRLSSPARGSKNDISESGRGVPRAESTSDVSVSSYEFRLILSGTWG